MILKRFCDRTDAIETLERLLEQSSVSARKNIARELRNVRAGIKGEKDAAYYIDFDLEGTKNWIVIHDLRVEVGGRVAQIDHLLINRVLQIYVLESKSFHASLKISEDGEFLRFNEWKRTHEGMPSPLAQNERHVAVLKEAIKEIMLPSRLGLRLEPSYEPFVLVSSKTRIDRPKSFDTSRIVKADVFVKTIRKRLDDENAAKIMMAMTKVIAQDTLEEIARQIAALHKPASIDYKTRFGVTEPSPTLEASTPVAPSAEKADQSSIACRQCRSTRLSVVYGKYGYYFKCSDCDGNTPIKVSCGYAGHKERIRKEGWRFFRECSQCGTSDLFYTNPGEPFPNSKQRA